jgi:hypothetical protein
MEDKITTIDDLARMINEVFKTTATKDDVTALRSEMNEKFDMVNSHLWSVRESPPRIWTV